MVQPAVGTQHQRRIDGLGQGPYGRGGQDRVVRYGRHHTDAQGLQILDDLILILSWTRLAIRATVWA